MIANLINVKSQPPGRPHAILPGRSYPGLLGRALLLGRRGADNVSPMRPTPRSAISAN